MNDPFLLILIMATLIDAMSWWQCSVKIGRDRWFTENLLKLYGLEKERHQGFKRHTYQKQIHEMLEEYEMDLSSYQGQDIIPMEIMEEKLTNYVMEQIEVIKQLPHKEKVANPPTGNDTRE